MVGRLKLPPTSTTQFGMLSRSQDKVANRQLHRADAKLHPALGREYIYLKRNHICRQSSSQTHVSLYMFWRWRAGRGPEQQ